MNRHYAVRSGTGVWHATDQIEEAPGLKSFCGVRVEHDADRPTARIDNDSYTFPSQWVECQKCENKVRNLRGVN